MKVRYVGIETAEPLTMDELRNMAKKKPVVVWVVCLDEETKEPDFETGEWEMSDGYRFVAVGTEDDYLNYGKTFIAYRNRPEEEQK